MKITKQDIVVIMWMFRKPIIVVFMLILCIVMLFGTRPAHAGFVTGVIVGSAMSGSSTVSNAATESITSPHDTIICRTYADGPICICNIPQKETRYLTPAQYAAAAGYKVLFKQSAIIGGNGDVYIIMEVGK